MHDASMHSAELEARLAQVQKQLAQIAEQPPKEDLLKQMGDTLVARVDQMSQLALKLLGSAGA